jgi:hypothetical protein
MVVYDQVYQIFMKKAKLATGLTRLSEDLEKVKSHRIEIAQAKQSGIKCRNQAVWIGLER